MADTYSFSEQCGATEMEPLLLFANMTTTDTFAIADLFAHRVTEGQSTTTFMPAFGIDRVTAYSGGNNVDFSSARSDSASLAGKATIAVQPATTTTPTRIRRYCQTNPTFDINSVPTLPYFAAWMNNFRHVSAQDGQGVLIGRGRGAAASIALAEGQGLAFSQESIDGTVQNKTTARMRFSVTVLVSGNCYVANFTVPSAHLTQKAFVIFNEVGSGITLTVLEVSVHFCSPGTYQNSGNTAYGARHRPAMSLLRVDYKDPPSGKDSITMIPAKSSAVSLSGKLVAIKGNELGDYLIRNEQVHYALRTASGLEVPNYSSAGNYGAIERCGTFRVYTDRAIPESTGASFKVSPLIVPIINVKKAPIILRPGEAVALMCMGARATDFLLSGTITYTPAAEVYPAVGDVDSGVQYGPTGTDYTGTLVQPAEADVESGVSYGAGGTEFTGTLVVGGGGGNTYSRGRVVNS